MNASSHYSVSEAIVGNKHERGWNIVFGTLAVAAMIEVFGNKYIIPTTRTDDDNNGGCTSYPKWWIVIRFVLAAVSLRIAAYTLLHVCFDASLEDMLSGW